jgi:hypothetical protein
MRKLLAFALLAACIMVIGASRSLRAQETSAAIQGTVTDPSGAVVPDAEITATSDRLITPAKTKTDIHGFYRLNALPPGTYTLRVTAAGMSATATNFSLAPGDLPTYNIKLSISAATTVVDVTADVALVDVTQTKVETVIDNVTLQQIPTGRSFQSVIPFAPGARQEPLQSMNSNRLNGFQIDGASNGKNVYASEGLNITSVVGGGVGVQVPMEFVQDVQVKSSSFEAEYGGALGGVINVIQQRGSSNWHGSFLGYYKSSALNSNDQCNFPGAVATAGGFQNTVNLYSTTCGQRLDPATTSSSATRTEQSAQYYIAQQDHFRDIDPGFTVGGPLLTNKVFAFASYIPDIIRVRRTVNFTGTNPGPRSFYQSQDAHFGLARLDYSPFSKLSVFGSMQYAYTRIVGALPNPDSKIGQRNASASSDPTTFRADTGSVNPLTLLTFGGNYTINSKTLVSARYGYFYQNTHDIGKPVGNRWSFQTTSTPGAYSGNAVPAAYAQSAGYANLGANQQFLYDQITRKQFTVDVSTLKTGWWGTHEFKGGYALYRTGENVLQGFKTAYTLIYPGQSYTTKTSATACNTVIAQNVAQWPGAPNVGTLCQGDYGYFIVQDGVDTTGSVSGNNDAFYGQDAWTVGHTGLTINAGVRFDKEYLPPYGLDDPVSVNFGFGSKIAPRIGVAYDVLHNGKLKVYGSYGKFFDIVKYSLPRGSFGGDYWHDCVYALDTPNYNLITPSAPNGHSCGATGPAPGVPSASSFAANSFRFIENQNWRAHTQDAADPQVDPHLKPMSQHEYVVGTDWAIKPTLAFSARFAHKYLDNTIEDISVNDAVYYIGNPGPGYGDPLHRPADQFYQLGTGGALKSQWLNPQGVCPSCPVQPKAIRSYNGAEFRITKNSSRGFISAFYTYSKLTGNYPGLTTTFSTDGGGGRANPNNNRSFDLPQMQFTAHGKPFGGPLPTDRPNTFGAYGSIHQKWMFGTSTLGFGQTIYQGTPVSTCWSTISGTSSCQFVEDQGNWVNLSRDAAGNFISNGISRGRRTQPYMQTDLNLSHYLPVNKDHENRRIGAEINVYNALNQHAITSYYETPVGNGNSALAPAGNNATTFDYNTLMTGFDYIGMSNAQGLWMANRYGQPNQFQLGRQVRLKVAYTF